MTAVRIPLNTLVRWVKMQNCLLILDHNKSLCVRSCSHCLGGRESRWKSRTCSQFNLRGLLMHGCVALDSTASFSGGSVEIRRLCVGEMRTHKYKARLPASLLFIARGYLKTNSSSVTGPTERKTCLSGAGLLCAVCWCSEANFKSGFWHWHRRKQQRLLCSFQICSILLSNFF